MPHVELYHFERRSIALHAGYTGTLASQYNRRLHHRRWDARIAELMTQRPEPPRGQERKMTDLATLRDHLSRNRFMPAPPPELMFCGDGDFRAIGAEFLERLVRDAGLERHHRVLDIGCGVGRLAIPLTQYLDEPGPTTASTRSPAASPGAPPPSLPPTRMPAFSTSTCATLYNPQGSLETARTPLPFPDASFDLVSMISVTTHLGPEDVLHYAARDRAPARSRRPLFCHRLPDELAGPRRARLRRRPSPLRPGREGPLYYANPGRPARRRSL